MAGPCAGGERRDTVPFREHVCVGGGGGAAASVAAIQTSCRGALQTGSRLAPTPTHPCSSAIADAPVERRPRRLPYPLAATLPAVRRWQQGRYRPRQRPGWPRQRRVGPPPAASTGAPAMLLWPGGGGRGESWRDVSRHPCSHKLVAPAAVRMPQSSNTRGRGGGGGRSGKEREWQSMGHGPCQVFAPTHRHLRRPARASS